MFIVATNVIASQSPKRRQTETLTARANVDWKKNSLSFWKRSFLLGLMKMR